MAWFEIDWCLNKMAPLMFIRHFEMYFHVRKCYEFRIVFVNVVLTKTIKQLTLAQVITSCCQATLHYFNQCQWKLLTPYGVTRLQWVKGMSWLSPGNIALFDCHGRKQEWSHERLWSHETILYNPCEVNHLFTETQPNCFPWSLWLHHIR